jgi:hypothetical protein
MQSEGEASPDGSRTAVSNLLIGARVTIPREKLEEISLRYKRLAGFDKDSLKSLGPLTISRRFRQATRRMILPVA